MKRFFIISALLCVVVCLLPFATVDAKKPSHLLPAVKQLDYLQNQPAFKLQSKLHYAGDSCALLKELLQSYGCTFTTADKAKGSVKLTLVKDIPNTYDYPLHAFPAEAYTLKLSGSNIEITAVNHIGFIRATQTLAQILTEVKSSCDALSITDYPAFKLRGWMHDVGRSFLSIEELKTQIRLLSQFKVNVFHWHFTENQAWRFQVKAYPQLTDPQYATRLPGLFYTQQECKELEAYAAKYGIMIIPEIDMPGHSEAYERAMKHSMQTDQGIAELKTILKEVAETFTLSPYIHIGGDEETITYPNFLEMMIQEVKNLGKQAIVWNPIRGVKLSADMGMAMTQMWSTYANQVDGVANIDCRYNYINHFDVFADLIGIYKSNIYYKSQGDKQTAGCITATWNDRQLPSEQDIVLQNNMYANVIASADRAWKGGGEQYIEKGGTYLYPNTPEFYEFQDWEQRFLYHKEHSLKEQVSLIPYLPQSHMVWKVTDAVQDTTTKTLSEVQSMSAREVVGGTVHLRHYWHPNVPSLYEEPQLNTTAYAYTYIYSPKAKSVPFYIEFQNYSRSERDQTPQSYLWDKRGSKLWVNGNLIHAPKWDNANKEITNEDLLLNENFTARPATYIQLQKGWNTVLLKLPYVPTPGIRLNKWMFTVVPNDSSLKFSTNPQ